MNDHSQTSLPAQYSEPLENDPMSAHGYPSQPEYRTSSKPKKSLAQLVQGFFRPKPSIMRTYTLPVNATVTALLGKNSRRSYLLIQNLGTIDVWITCGGVPSILGAVKLAPNAVWIFEAGIVPTNELSAISATGSTLAITEGTYEQ